MQLPLTEILTDAALSLQEPQSTVGLWVGSQNNFRLPAARLSALRVLAERRFVCHDPQSSGRPAAGSQGLLNFFTAARVLLLELQKNLAQVVEIPGALSGDVVV